MNKTLQTAATIRKFNRIYLPYFHLLAQKYLNSECSIAEARILYEIYDTQEINAKDIVGRLHIDKGYLSRILKKCETKSLIKRKVSEDDFRMTCISLTAEGKKFVENLIHESNRQIEKDLADIPEDDLDRLSFHIEEIIKILRGNKIEN